MSGGAMAEARIRVLKDDHGVYLEVDGVETHVDGQMAKELGEALFKAGCDVVRSEADDKN